MEETKNRLDRSLQQDVAAYKADLDVISGQRARFLERKIDSILEINKFHVLAVKDFVIFISTFCDYIVEAASYYIYQADEKEPRDYSSYDIYAQLKRERWPQVMKPAKASLERYSEELALTMPIFPKDFALKELEIVSDLKNIQDRSERLFYRTMGLTSEIIQSEEDMTPEECLTELKEHMHESLKLKEKVENYNEKLLTKAEESCKLIESLLYA